MPGNPVLCDFFSVSKKSDRKYRRTDNFQTAFSFRSQCEHGHGHCDAVIAVCLEFPPYMGLPPDDQSVIGGCTSAAALFTSRSIARFG
jgi:hypothetical protein